MITPTMPTKAEAELGTLLDLNSTFVAAAAYPEDKVIEMTEKVHKSKKLSTWVTVPFGLLFVAGLVGSMWKDEKTHDPHPLVTAAFVLGMVGGIGGGKLDKRDKLRRDVKAQGTKNLLALYNQSIGTPAP